MTGTEDHANDRKDRAAAREARLAEALRANLRRRKTQARARAATADPPANPAPGKDTDTE